VQSYRRTKPAALDTDAARNKLLRALTRRSLTHAESAHKLTEWGVAHTDATAILNDFTRAGYLNDRRFAENFTTGRLARGFGWNRIRQELARHKVPSALIDEVHQKMFGETSKSEPTGDLLEVTAAKEWRKLAKEEPDVRRRRWLGRMQRRGFTLDRILNVLRALERQEKVLDDGRYADETGGEFERISDEEE